jgi:hypothetical protein
MELAAEWIKKTVATLLTKWVTKNTSKELKSSFFVFIMVPLLKPMYKNCLLSLAKMRNKSFNILSTFESVHSTINL